MNAALLLTTEDTLSRPLPHVYQIEAESHQAIPIVVPENVQQEANAAVGSGIGSMSDVNVKDLRVIANQQVKPKCLGRLAVIPPWTSPATLSVSSSQSCRAERHMYCSQNQKMQAMVMKPLNQWLTVFKGFSSKMRALEHRRLGMASVHTATCVIERQTSMQGLAVDTSD